MGTEAAPGKVAPILPVQMASRRRGAGTSARAWLRVALELWGHFTDPSLGPAPARLKCHVRGRGLGCGWQRAPWGPCHRERGLAAQQSEASKSAP